MRTGTTPYLQQALREATALTRSGDLAQATAAIRRALSGVATVPGPQAGTSAAPRPVSASGRPRQGAEAMMAGSFDAPTRMLDYRVYLPAPEPGRAMPLLLMLHGCTQDPDDFAAGTGMNALARQAGVCVLYPAQSQRANASRCWNWFLPEHQQRGGGEPAALAALVRSITGRFGLDPARVYVAGLSAGGAMAAVLAAVYPDLFAAVGVHSGLAPGSAANVAQALAMMKSGAAGPSRRPGAHAADVAALRVPTIVFHGDADHTVHPANGGQVLAAALAGRDAVGSAPHRECAVAAGRRYVRTLHRDVHGQTMAEHWQVEGLGHAWSGGQAAGSHTDTTGPDASAQMLRFFLQHRLPQH